MDLRGDKDLREQVGPTPAEQKRMFYKVDIHSLRSNKRKHNLNSSRHASNTGQCHHSTTFITRNKVPGGTLKWVTWTKDWEAKGELIFS